MKNIFVFTLVLCGLFLASCGSDSVDCDDATAINSRTNELNSAIESAGIAWVADPTNSDRCKEFKNAIEEIIDYGEDIEDCIPAEDKADFDEGLKELMTQLDDLVC